MYSNVSFQVGDVGKRSGTLLTLEGSLTAVDSTVTLQVGCSLERCRALRAYEGLLLAVYGFVTPQESAAVKLAGAHVTGVDFLPFVDCFVLFQFQSAGESFLTHLTTSALTVVHAKHVLLQLGRFFKRR